MQYKDEKKEFEIVFERIRNKGCGSYPVFKMLMEKPVKGEARFEVRDIKTQQGYTGINLYSGSEIAKALKSKGKDVLIVVAPEVLDFVRKTHEEERNKVIEEAKKDPETWITWEGCDTGMMYISPNTELGWEFRKDLEKVKDVLEKEFYSTPKVFCTGIKNDRGNVIVPHEVVMEVYNKIMEKKNAKKADKVDKENAILETAKQTGEKQVIESYSVECNDPHEECDVDIITVYAMPDGTKKTVRSHTW